MMSSAGPNDRPLDSSRPDDTRVGLIENEDAQRSDQSSFQGGQGYPK